MLVYPACAGIDRIRAQVVLPVPGLPRMRGDRPKAIIDYFVKDKFTPHARGSTSQRGQLTRMWPVYPACAGIDLLSFSQHSSSKRLPRMRGDRPWKTRLIFAC